MSPEDRRLTLALLVSLLIHTLLLRLTFGGQGLGLPGLRIPWQDRRIEAPDLRVVVVPAQVTAVEPAVAPVAEPLQQAEQPVGSRPARTPSVPRAPAAGRFVAAVVPKANPKAHTNPKTDEATAAATAQTPLRGDRPGDTARPPPPAPDVIALERIDEPTWVVPATPAMQTPVIVPAPSASIPKTAMPSLRDAGDALARINQEALERPVEMTKLDPSKQEGQRQAEQQEAARQEAARQEAARAENARLEAKRQEAARQEAARQDTARQEAARQETALQEAARQEAARQKAAQQEAARQEAARQEAARVEAQEAEARREARLRAIGRQLDEEAARREAATAAARQSGSLPPPSWSPARRYRLFGRTDTNEEIIRYAEAWERKIQMNMTLDMVREAAKRPHADPLVTVAIRSDGSVEKITFVQSSGVQAIDEAIRRIVDSQKPYQAFPTSLAREYDVLEIRRTWYFEVAIRLY